MIELNKTLISTIHLLCDYMTTRHQSKKHGGYNIYEDDKVYISLDTYVPNITVYVKLSGNTKSRVLSIGHAGTIQEYHSGKWEEYIISLKEAALTAKKELEEKKEIKDKQEHERK